MTNHEALEARCKQVADTVQHLAYICQCKMRIPKRLRWLARHLMQSASLARIAFDGIDTRYGAPASTVWSVTERGPMEPIGRRGDQGSTLHDHIWVRSFNLIEELAAWVDKAMAAQEKHHAELDRQIAPKAIFLNTFKALAPKP